MALTKPRAYQIYDIDYKQAVRVVTTSNITLSLGAPNSVDGVNLSVNDRILVTGQSNGAQNGIYYVVTLGTGANGTWSRSQDTNTTGELDAGTIVMVTEGTTYADTQWKLITDDPIVIGSTALTFVLNVQANSISSGSSNVVVNANANVTVSSAGISNVLIVTSTGTVTSGTANVSGNITGGNLITGGLVSTTGNINTSGALNINSTDGNYNVLNISGTALAPYGTPQTWKFFTNNTALGGAASFILFPDSSTQITAYPGTASALSLSANITGGNLISNSQVTASGNITGGNILTGGNLVTSGLASVTGNVTGGNILTVGQVSSTGTITTAAGTNSTGFAVGNGAVSNVGLGFFPTAGTRGDYAIRDYSSVFSTIYLDVGMGGSAGGEFQFRSSNAYNLVMRANTTGVYSAGIISGTELTSTQSAVNEGGQINLALPSSGSTLSTSVIIDVYQDRLRFFEGGGTARGAYIDLTSCSAGAATNLLAGGGGGGTPGGSNTNVQFNDAGTFGGNGQFTYDKVTNILTAGIISANNNGLGTNFKVGDDAWIGDINTADTIGLKGQQNPANCYIVFGNSDATGKLGRAGTGPLTYSGEFSATGNITGGNVSATLFTGSGASLTNLNGSNIASGTIPSARLSGTYTITVSGAATTAGTVTTAAQPNITSVGTLSSLAVTANVTGGNLITGGLISAVGTVTGSQFNGSGAGLTSIPGANVTGTVPLANNSGYLNSITAVNLYNNMGETHSARTQFDATTPSYDFGYRYVQGSTNGPGTSGSQFYSWYIGLGSQYPATGAGSYGAMFAVDRNVTNPYLSVRYNESNSFTTWKKIYAGYADTAGTVTTAAQPNITSVGTLSSLTVTNDVSLSSVTKTGTTGVGNIGSSSNTFNTVFAKATSAQYADVAEYYAGDSNYEPGTVVIFGGEAEITQSTLDADNAVAGVVSTNPAYIMNSGIQATYSIPVALTGRVPTRVIGPVRKGNMMVSAENGYARACATPSVGTVIGKAIENFDGDRGIIEVVVGRM